MVERNDRRLETACRCLDLERPRKKERLNSGDRVCNRRAGLMDALSDPIRLRVLEMLDKGPLYVCLIQHLLGDIKYSKLSYHLDILKEKGLISSKRQGNFLLYSITLRGKRTWSAVQQMDG